MIQNKNNSMEFADTKEDIVVASDIYDPIIARSSPSATQSAGLWFLRYPEAIQVVASDGERNHCTPTSIALMYLTNAPFHQRSRLLWHNPSLDKL